MTETTSSGFAARNNELLGSLLSIAALLAAVGTGAGLMLGTGTRGVSAILTVLLVAGGGFTLLLIAIGATLRAVTDPAQWRAEEDTWRDGMGLSPYSDTDQTASSVAQRKAAAIAVAALVAGLCLSVVPWLL